jgi:hypothetical protein
LEHLVNERLKGHPDYGDRQAAQFLVARDQGVEHLNGGLHWEVRISEEHAAEGVRGLELAAGKAR